MTAPSDRLDFTGLDFPIHPAADLVPPMSKEEFDGFVADIKKRGLVEPIHTIGDEGNEQILEGRHRALACKLTKQKPVYRPYLGDDPYGFVLAKNIHRRHLAAEGKRDTIAKLLKAQPEKSDRQIATTIKASPTTVGKVRSEMEKRGDVSRMDTRTDTTGRQQPATKHKGTARFSFQVVHPEPEPPWQIVAATEPAEPDPAELPWQYSADPAEIIDRAVCGAVAEIKGGLEWLQDADVHFRAALFERIRSELDALEQQFCQSRRDVGAS
jgi:hypothetical protein